MLRINNKSCMLLVSIRNSGGVQSICTSCVLVAMVGVVHADVDAMWECEVGLRDGAISASTSLLGNMGLCIVQTRVVHRAEEELTSEQLTGLDAFILQVLLLLLLLLLSLDDELERLEEMSAAVSH